LSCRTGKIAFPLRRSVPRSYGFKKRVRSSLRSKFMKIATGFSGASSSSATIWKYDMACVGSCRLTLKLSGTGRGRRLAAARYRPRPVSVAAKCWKSVRGAYKKKAPVDGDAEAEDKLQ